MSGHSKWASIKRKKGATDHARGKVFSRYAREIMVAARDGGGDPELNPRLRLVISKAKREGMPSDTVERAVKKGTGELEGAEALEECIYEGYGPHGVAIMLDALTDNRNRTVGDIRSVFNKLGGSLGESGCVAYQFELRGLIQVDRAGVDEDAVLEVILDAGADDLTTGDGSYEIVCEPESLNAVVAALQAAGMAPSDYELARVPSAKVALEADQARRVLRLLDALEDVDDVQRVSSNIEISDDVLEALGAES